MQAARAASALCFSPDAYYGSTVGHICSEYTEGNHQFTACMTSNVAIYTYTPQSSDPALMLSFSATHRRIYSFPAQQLHFIHRLCCSPYAISFHLKKKTATYFSAYATSGATPEPKLWDKQRKNCLKAVRAPTCRGLWSTTRDEPGHSIGQCLLFPVRFPTQLSAHSVLPPSEPNRVMTSSHKSPNHLLSFLADSNSAEREILSDGYSFECSWHGRSNY